MTLSSGVALDHGENTDVYVRIDNSKIAVVAMKVILRLRSFCFCGRTETLYLSLSEVGLAVLLSLPG